MIKYTLETRHDHITLLMTYSSREYTVRYSCGERSAVRKTLKNTKIIVPSSSNVLCLTGLRSSKNILKLPRLCNAVKFKRQKKKKITELCCLMKNIFRLFFLFVVY